MCYGMSFLNHHDDTWSIFLWLFYNILALESDYKTNSIFRAYSRGGGVESADPHFFHNAMDVSVLL